MRIKCGYVGQYDKFNCTVVDMMNKRLEKKLNAV